MASFLVEVYAPGGSDDLADAAARLRLAARAVSRGGAGVRHVRAILVPEDETCFHVFESVSAVAVEEVARRAGLGHVRIVEAVEALERREG